MAVNRGERGMTLLEVVVAMGVSLALLAAGTVIYVNGVKDSVANQAYAMGNTQAQNLATTIENDIQQGAVVLDSSNGFTTGPLQLILQIPSWDSSLEATTTSSDVIAYKFYDVITDGSGTHKVYNIQRKVIPGPGSSRTASDTWMFPYNAAFDATDPSQYRSDPYIQTWSDSGTPTIFKYYVQDGATGAVKAKGTGDAWSKVVLVETRMAVKKKFDTTTLQTDLATRTRLRNWQP
jgi:type II secretory pathway pseudopilin PulG